MVENKETQNKLMNILISNRLKGIAEKKAIREGRSLSGYIRFLIEKDNK